MKSNLTLVVAVLGRKNYRKKQSKLLRNGMADIKRWFHTFELIVQFTPLFIHLKEIYFCEYEKNQTENNNNVTAKSTHTQSNTTLILFVVLDSIKGEKRIFFLFSQKKVNKSSFDLICSTTFHLSVFLLLSCFLPQSDSSKTKYINVCWDSSKSD